MWKKILIVLSTLVISLVSFGMWFMSLLPDNSSRQDLVNTQAQDLAYLKRGVRESRGNILAVVTSSDVMGSSGKSTGYELTELARAYYVFTANGFEVDIASPKGGTPPIVIDGDDMGRFDYAFLNDPEAQAKVNNSIVLKDISPTDYQAVYFVGGKGAMFDFPQNTAIQNIVRSIYQSGGIVGAVCHGPSALANVTLDNGSALVSNKTVSSFTNEEELFLIPDAREVFPFLLEDKLISQGAKFNAGPRYLEQISQDGNLITGQNPWSVWKLAEAMISELGYEPIPRQITAEENSVSILYTYETRGYRAAFDQMQGFLLAQDHSVDRVLIAMHSVVALMDWEFVKIVDLLRLLNSAKNTKISMLENEYKNHQFPYPIA